MNGGSEKVTYYASFNYLDQGGLLEYGEDGLSRYNVAAKINANITKWLKFKENQESQKNDRPTFVIKWLQKREKFDLIECENSGNADVVPYL